VIIRVALPLIADRRAARAKSTRQLAYRAVRERIDACAPDQGLSSSQALDRDTAGSGGPCCVILMASLVPGRRDEMAWLWRVLSGRRCGRATCPRSRSLPWRACRPCPWTP